MKTAVLVLFFVLAAVAAGPVRAAETPVPDSSLCGPYPKIYKEIIWNWLQKSLLDANSAKIEWQTEPKCTDLGQNGEHLYGWLVDFTINSRNRFGSYTGKQKLGALIRNGEVIKGIGFGY